MPELAQVEGVALVGGDVAGGAQDGGRGVETPPGDAGGEIEHYEPGTAFV